MQKQAKRTCVKCHKPIKVNTLFCPACGAPQPAWLCPVCHSENLPQATHCLTCGIALPLAKLKKSSQSGCWLKLILAALISMLIVALLLFNLYTQNQLYVSATPNAAATLTAWFSSPITPSFEIQVQPVVK